MKTEDLYKKKNECCGCELCAQSCPKNVIQMVEDEGGFLYPNIEDESNCINCQRCINVCPAKSPGREIVDIKNSFSFSLPEQADLKKSASGGLATAISREFIKRGGVVYGVAYTNEFREARFVRATSEDELEQYRGSKYVQATKGNIYSQVRIDLKEGKDVLFIGLPCEISALYHAVSHTERLYTISLICHGPTSQKVHRDYLDSLPNTKKTSLSFFSVRYKLKGWKPYFIHAEYAAGNEYNEQWNQSDYGIAFLYLKRPSCRNCRYKVGDAQFGLQSDLTIGDFHAVKKESSQYNPWGVSQGSIQTDKGRYLTTLIDADLLSNSISEHDAIKLNKAFYASIEQRGNGQRFIDDFVNKSLHEACHSSMVKRTELFRKLQRYFSKVTAVRKIVKRIFNHFQIR